MITWNKQIDHNNPLSEHLYRKLLDGFRKACIEKVIDRKTLYSKRRIVRRAIERKQFDMEKEIDGNIMIHRFTSKGAVVGVMRVTFENFPIKTETEPIHE